MHNYRYIDYTVDTTNLYNCTQRLRSTLLYVRTAALSIAIYGSIH